MNEFFRSFQVFHIIWKQTYKLKLLTKLMIDDLFHISLLEQNITNKRQVDKQALPKLKRKFEVGNKKEYKLEAVIDNTVYSHAVETHLLCFYYLVL